MNSKLSIVTLTPAESKRLIAKYVVTMPEVRNAFENGIILLLLSSSNGYIYEELSGKKIDRSSHLCGMIMASGGCGSYLPLTNKREFYFENGVEKNINFPLEDPTPLLERMGPDDIIFKSGNFLDSNGVAGTLVGEPDGLGGEWGKSYPHVLRGVKLIAPMILSKSVHGTFDDIYHTMGLGKIDYDHTMATAEIMPMPGQVVTEIDAIKGLTGADAKVVAVNGVGTGEGSVTLAVYGETQARLKAWDLIVSIKGEPKLEPVEYCRDCQSLRNHGLCKVKTKKFGAWRD